MVRSSYPTSYAMQLASTSRSSDRGGSSARSTGSSSSARSPAQLLPQDRERIQLGILQQHGAVGGLADQHLVARLEGAASGAVEGDEHLAGGGEAHLDRQICGHYHRPLRERMRADWREQDGLQGRVDDGAVGRPRVRGGARGSRDDEAVRLVRGGFAL